MIARTSRLLDTIVVSLVAVLVILTGPARALVAQAVPEPRSLTQLSQDWFTVIVKAGEARRTGKTSSDAEQIRNELAAQHRSFADRFLAMSREHAGDWSGIAALNLVACRAPNTEQGQQALESLLDRAASADLGVLEQGLSFATNVPVHPIRRVAPIVLDRVKKTPDHPQAAKLLASVVCKIAVDGYKGAEPPAEFAEAANLIVDRYATSADIVNFCELLGMGVGSPAWANPFETHLRTIRRQNPHREVQVVALFALASIIQGTTASRQAEADAFYQEFIAKYDGSQEYHFAGIEKALNEEARTALKEIQLRGLGKPAPEITGVDLDGRAMTLSEHRGKVVLLSFWATWCGPCMKMVPHERDLANRLEDKPFAIVGINADGDLKAATDAVAEHGMTWRSFRNERKEDGPTISEDWVIGFPTFYVIDREGIIRKRWLGETTLEELNAVINPLLEQQPASETVE